MKSLALIVMSLLSASASAAQPCVDNFRVDGNLVLGKVYATEALLLNATPSAAFDAALAYTSANGFTVEKATKPLGTIAALESDTIGRTKRIRLNVKVEPDAYGHTRMTINYIVTGTPTLADEAIKQHFCNTIAAADPATAAQQAAAQAAQAGQAPADPSARPPLPGFAAPTKAQLDGYRDVVMKSVTGDRVRQLAKEAAPAISTYIQKLACINDLIATQALEEHAAPQVYLRNQWNLLAGIRNTNYHDKSACLSVIRVQGWRMPANNALVFEAVYKADDSGQSAKIEHEAVRQPDGVWLFTR